MYCLVQPSQTLDAEASKGPGEKWKVGPQYEVKQLIGSGPQWDLSHDLQSPVPLCRSRFQTALLPGPALTVASVKPLTPPRGVRGTQRKEFDKVTFAGNDHKTCFFFGTPVSDTPRCSASSLFQGVGTFSALCLFWVEILS